MADRVVLVTGGAGGIGKATALALASEIRATDGRVEVFVAGLPSQSEVRRLADEVLQRRRAARRHPQRYRAAAAAVFVPRHPCQFGAFRHAT
jgi:NAD(P)-dependent dehydrogenase (short-subunit alcohol dehydrogenase family)